MLRLVPPKQKVGTCGSAMESRLVVAESGDNDVGVTAPALAVHRVYRHAVRGSGLQVRHCELGYHPVRHVVHYVVGAVTHFSDELLRQAAVESLHTADLQPSVAAFDRSTIVWSVRLACVNHNNHYTIIQYVFHLVPCLRIVSD